MTFTLVAMEESEGTVAKFHVWLNILQLSNFPNVREYKLIKQTTTKKHTNKTTKLRSLWTDVQTWWSNMAAFLNEIHS